MKLTQTLLAAVVTVALAGPALAAGPTLSTTSTTTQSAVTTTVAPACALTGSLTTFNVSVTPNGDVTLPSDQPITVTCNTPNGSITIGSNDMENNAAPAIVETGTFTKTINFNGRAFDLATGYELDSRTGGGLSTATVGYDTTQRIRTLQIGVRNAAPFGNLLPVAGQYAGYVCVTVDPSSALVGTAGSDSNTFCDGVTGIMPPAL
jgi:hypothetical protein